MVSKQTHSKDFLVGAAVGSLLGSVTALLVAPKAGKKLRQDINDLYSDLTDRTQDAADHFTRKGKSFAKSFSGHSHDLADKAKCLVCGVKNLVGYGHEEEEEDTTRDLLIGGAIGGLLGAVAGLLLAPKSGSDLREDIADTYEEFAERTHDAAEQFSKRGKTFAKTAKSKANKWIDFAKEIVDEFSDEVEEKSEEFADKAKNRVNDIVEWASLGYRVWQGLNKRK